MLINNLINFGFVRKEVIQNHETYFDLEVDPEHRELLHVISRKKYLNIIEFLTENDNGI